MNEKELENIQSEFRSLSNNLLNSNIDTFKANLSGFKDFCNATNVICDILSPILQTNFNGIEYFSKKSNPGSRFEDFPKPQNRNELFKVSYDVLWKDNINAGRILNYGRWAIDPSATDMNELLEIGNNDISLKLIDYIDLELTKLINNTKETVVTNQFNITSATGSIIGTQENATISNSYNLDELEKIIDHKVSDINDKQQLQDLIKSLKAITENNIPVQKGTLARFGDILAKHAWITGAIAKSLIGWMTGH